MLLATRRRTSVALLLTTGLVGSASAAPAWALGTPDQEQAGAREGAFMVFAGRDNSQSFVAGRTGRLDRIELRLGQNAGADSAEQVAVRVQGAEGFYAVPTSPVLGETGVAAKDVTPDFGWTSVDLTEPVSVTEGQKYAIVLSSTVPSSAAFTWTYTLDDPYASGVPSTLFTTEDGAEWNPQPDKDLGFRTYVDAGIDGDDDGFGAFQECDDTDAAVNPDATETYNQVDDDCDGAVDEGFTTAGAPGIRSATSGTAGGAVTATAAWRAPTSTGGLPITGYTVQAQRLNAAGAIVSRTSFSARPAARSLAAPLRDARYTFRVAARNAKGKSPWSTDSNVVRAR